jgi:hypothetical protein
MKEITDLTRQYEANLRAKAFVAYGVGKALFGRDWARHVESVSGVTHASELITATKALVPGATTFDPNWMGPAADMRLYSNGFLELVRPLEVPARLLGASRAPMNVNIPRQTLEDDPTLDWVGELRPAPVARFSFDLEPIPPGKLAGIVAITKELARLGSAAQSIIERLLVRAAVRGTNSAFLDPTRAAVANVSPASITFGATEITSTGEDAAAVESDVKDLLAALSDGEPLRPYAVMSSSMALFLATLRTNNGTRVFPGVGLTGGDLLGVPILIANEALNHLIVIDASGIVLADVGIELDAVQHASLQQDDAPSQGPTNLISLFQADAIALMVTRWISWTRRSDAVAYLSIGGSPGGSPF